MQDFEVGGKLALYGEGCSRDPAVEVHLSPVAFDRRGKPMDGEPDERSGEQDNDQQLSRYARETNGNQPICRGPLLEVNSIAL